MSHVVERANSRHVQRAHVGQQASAKRKRAAQAANAAAIKKAASAAGLTVQQYHQREARRKTSLIREGQAIMAKKSRKSDHHDRY